MIRRMMAVMLVIIICYTACAENDIFTELVEEAREKLLTTGIKVSDETAAEVIEASRRWHEMEEKWSEEYGISCVLPTVEDAVYDLLIFSGLGDFNYDTFEWTPLNNKIYTFDAEVFDVEHMYSLFLQGMQSIIPDIVIDDITEEILLSGNFIFFDGFRKVSFTANGHPYSFTLKDQHDWFDDRMIAHFKSVMKTEGCEYKLHQLSDGWDQMCILYYGPQENANEIIHLIGSKK